MKERPEASAPRRAGARAAGLYGLEPRAVDELELVIAGGGAAGLCAALYASLLGINHVLLDAEEGGGLLRLAKSVENFPGVSGLRGPAIAARLMEQLSAAGGELRTHEAVTGIELPAGSADGRGARGDAARLGGSGSIGATERSIRGGAAARIAVRTNRGTYRPKALILATGLELLGLADEFGVEGERAFLGRGVSYCAECDAPLFRGKRVIVAGNPFDAFLIRRLTREVTYLGPVPDEYRNQVPREIIEANDIAYREGRIERLEGRSRLEALVIDGERVAADGLFLTKRKSRSELYARAGVQVDGEGFVAVNARMETNAAGVFAAGDITGEPWQISKSVGQGAIAALGVFKFLTGNQMRNLGWALQDEWVR